jgi:hypothetical protein
MLYLYSLSSVFHKKHPSDVHHLKRFESAREFFTTFFSYLPRDRSLFDEALFCKFAYASYWKRERERDRETESESKIERERESERERE